MVALDVEHSLVSSTSAERLVLTESDMCMTSTVTPLFHTVIVSRLFLQLLPYNVTIIKR